MSLLFTKSDDTALTGITFTIERGVPSTHLAVKIKNDGASSVASAVVAMYAEQTPGSGIYVTSGHAVVNERMGRFEITSVDTSGTAGQEGALGNVQILGAAAVALLPTILPGNAILADIWLDQGTSSVSGGTVNIKFEIANTGVSVPIGDGISMFATGILTGLGQYESFLISGNELTESSPTDHDVHIAAGSWVTDGVEYSDAGVEDVTLDNLDVNLVALSAGYTYIAALFRGTNSTITVVKAARSTSVLKPSTFLGGHIFVGFATVFYTGVGTWTVQAGAYMGLGDFPVTYGRLVVTEPGTGLDVTVGSGKAITGGFLVVHPANEVLTLTPSATNYIWITPAGDVVVTLTDTPPSVAALTLATAITDATDVTSLVDTRVFIGGTGAGVVAHAASHATAGSDPVSPASIGAAATSHTHAEADVTGLVADLALKAALASPTFTGTPAAPTAVLATSTTQLATTAFVKAAIAGGVHRTIVTKATADSPYAVVAADYVILANTSGGNLTITLPAAPAAGRWLEIKKVSDNVNTLTIDGNGNNVDGAATLAFTTQNRSVSLLFDSTFDWAIM